MEVELLVSPNEKTIAE